MHKKNKTWMHKKRYKALAVIIVVLIAVRIALPFVVLHYANKKLADLDAFYGHIDDVDIALYRGAYKVVGIYIDKKDTISGNRTEFFKSDIIDLSVEWSALFNGSFVGELIFERPGLIFTKDKAEPKDIDDNSADLESVLDGLMPLKLNRIEINNGVIKYVDQNSQPPVNIQMDKTFILAQNLSSVVDSALLPSTIRATSNIYGGTLQFDMKLNALKENPTFDINAELEKLQLPELNEFFQAYANVDVNKGTLGLYTEVAAKEGKFVGYVKPIIKELDVVGEEDRDDSFWQKVWENLVGATAVALRNHNKEQVATKLPISGTFKDTDTQTWYAIMTLLKNAFIQALQPSIDAEIGIESVDKETANKEISYLHKVFNGSSREVR